MKKKISLLFFLLFLLPCVFFFVACGSVKFKVNFMVDGIIYEVVTTDGNQTISIPKDPTKDRYEFDGWFWDENIWQKPFTANSLLDQPLTSDMKIYAKWSNSEQLNGTDVRFRNFEYIENEIYSIKVNNDIEILNFSDIVEINSQSTWTLNTDIYATNSIPSKIATLHTGDNVYYVLVTAQNNEVKLYTLKIRRLPMYTVTYKDSEGEILSTLQVQEGDYIQPIEEIPECLYYTFENWSYDFTQPIMSDKDINPQYTPTVYTISYVLNGGINNENNPTTYTIESPTITLLPAIFTNQLVSRWYSENTFENRITQIDSGSHGDKTIYARAGYDGYDTCIIDNNVVIGFNEVFLNEFNITDIIIPDGATSIKNSAFKSNITIKSVLIPNSVTDIGASAFSGCSSLTSINIPSGITKISENTFYNCESLISIEVPSSVTGIQSEAFSGCSSLTSINIPNGVTGIGWCSFYNCTSLRYIIIPDSVTYISDGVFGNCANLSIYMYFESKSSAYCHFGTNWDFHRPVYWYGEWSLDENNQPKPIDLND